MNLIKYKSGCRNCGSNCFGKHTKDALCKGHNEFRQDGSMFSDGTYCKEYVPSENLEYLEWKYDQLRII